MKAKDPFIIVEGVDKEHALARDDEEKIDYDEEEELYWGDREEPELYWDDVIDTEDRHKINTKILCFNKRYEAVGFAKENMEPDERYFIMRMSKHLKENE